MKADFLVKKNKMSLKVAIIEDNEETLNRYRTFINNSDKMEYVSGVTSVENFLSHIVAFKETDVLLLDINLPGMSGLQAITKIKRKLPKLIIVMLTTFADTESIFQAFRAGASGYLLKDNTQYELQKLLLSIKEDGAPIAPEVAKKVVDYFNPPKSFFSGNNTKGELTKTENLVLHNLVKGLTYQEVADEMEIKINTVRHHIKNIYKKLQVNSRAKLIDRYKNLN